MEITHFHLTLKTASPFGSLLVPLWSSSHRA